MNFLNNKSYRLSPNLIKFHAFHSICFVGLTFPGMVFRLFFLYRAKHSHKVKPQKYSWNRNKAILSTYINSFLISKFRFDNILGNSNESMNSHKYHGFQLKNQILENPFRLTSYFNVSLLFAISILPCHLFSNLHIWYWFDCLITRYIYTKTSNLLYTNFNCSLRSFFMFFPFMSFHQYILSQFWKKNNWYLHHCYPLLLTNIQHFFLLLQSLIYKTMK